LCTAHKIKHTDTLINDLVAWKKEWKESLNCNNVFNTNKYYHSLTRSRRVGDKVIIIRVKK
jgi:hypothetical protein